MNGNGLVLFGLLFLLVNGGNISVTQALLLLTLFSTVYSLDKCSNFSTATV